MTSVWIVDDDEDSASWWRWRCANTAHRIGARVQRRRIGGERGPLAAGDELPDLVLLDFHMPRSTGLDVLRQLRRVQPQVPVAILSNAANDEEMRACLAEKPLAFLRKPLGFRPSWWPRCGW